MKRWLVAGLLWILLVLVGYYAIHKPVTGNQVLALIGVIIHLISALLLAGLAGGVGRRLLPANQLTPLERFGLQAALGWGILGLVWLVAGMSGAYRPVFAWGGLLVGWIFLWRENIYWYGELKAFGQIWQDSGFFGRLLASFAGAFIGLQLVYALAPPAQWDALMYHLELPRRYLEQGRFNFISWNPYWGQPQLGEMTYTWGMLLSGEETAAVIGWLFQVILLVGLLGSVHKRVGSTAGWVAALALLSGFSFRWLMGSAYVDGLASLMGYATLICLLEWVEKQSDRWLVWAGVLAGFAVVSKLTALLLLPLLAISVLIVGLHRSWRDWSKALLAPGIALIIFSPWLLVNTVYTGNPLFPQIWPTEWTSQERLTFFERPGESAGYQVLWMPLAATWYGLETSRVEGMVSYGSDVGPLLILLAVPGLIAGRKSLTIRVLTIWLLGGWLGMAIGGTLSPLLWQSRLYWVLLPAAGMAVGFGWQALDGIQAFKIRLGRIVAACIILVCALSLWQDLQAAVVHKPLDVVLGIKSSEDYLKSRLGWFMPAMLALRQLPGETRTLFLWEPRGYYSPSSSLPDVWIDRWYLARRESESPIAILDEWKQAGFTHLLVYHDGAEFEHSNRPELSPKDWQVLDELLSLLKLQDDFGGIYQLYSLTP